MLVELRIVTILHVERKNVYCYELSPVFLTYDLTIFGQSHDKNNQKFKDGADMTATFPRLVWEIQGFIMLKSVFAFEI